MKELGSLIVPVVAALPGSGTAGQLVSFGGTIYQYSGTAWIDLSTQNVTVSKVAADITNATTTSQNTGLSFIAAVNGSYTFTAVIMYASPVTTAGIRVSVTGPATPTMAVAVVETQLTASTWNVQTLASYAAGTATTTVDVATAVRMVRVTGVIVNGSTAGAVNIQFASSTTVAIAVKKGSSLQVI